MCLRVRTHTYTHTHARTHTARLRPSVQSWQGERVTESSACSRVTARIFANQMSQKEILMAWSEGGSPWEKEGKEEQTAGVRGCRRVLCPRFRCWKLIQPSLPGLHLSQHRRRTPFPCDEICVCKDLCLQPLCLFRPFVLCQDENEIRRYVICARSRKEEWSASALPTREAM